MPSRKQSAAKPPDGTVFFIDRSLGAESLRLALEQRDLSVNIHDDHFKRLKVMQDADAIVDDCADLIARHGLDAEEARRVVASAMLAEQPLPLIGPNGRRP